MLLLKVPDIFRVVLFDGLEPAELKLDIIGSDAIQKYADDQNVESTGEFKKSTDILVIQ